MEASRKQSVISAIIARGMYQKVIILWNGRKLQYRTLTKAEFLKLIHLVGRQTPGEEGGQVHA
ncbi:hypothetical protein BK138_32330 [Paenibacillus rhizosphaerae]|uniref:Uncharacterized protein n=1 Tax=Paenibacillus rhizosphaerae TaxID=297318 RepID=A0A1R1E691_9BACL|nr:hypothetical protein BK138_32330 [Paenibacillus rhizosphaerae]